MAALADRDDAPRPGLRQAVEQRDWPARW